MYTFKITRKTNNIIGTLIINYEGETIYTFNLVTH